MARELVDLKVDVIIAVTGIGATEARQASRTIPIVVVVEGDPVGSGLIESLAHPGGNVTGLSLMAVDLSGKRLALLHEVVPHLSRIALMIDPKDVASPRIAASYTAAAKGMGIELRMVEVPTPASIDTALSTLVRDGIDGLIVASGSMMFNERARIGSFVLANKLPTEVAVAEMVPFGPLLSYGPDFPDFFRRAAAYADKILKGAKPADLPVEQPSRFKLMVNVKAAKSMGVTVPATILTSADEVIE
jgi:putative ABC transport system substrate-binding protein